MRWRDFVGVLGNHFVVIIVSDIHKSELVEKQLTLIPHQVEQVVMVEQVEDLIILQVHY